jgi:hypothetical protein
MQYKYTHVCALPVLAALGLGIALALLPLINRLFTAA